MKTPAIYSRIEKFNQRARSMGAIGLMVAIGLVETTSAEQSREVRDLLAKAEAIAKERAAAGKIPPSPKATLEAYHKACAENDHARALSFHYWSDAIRKSEVVALPVFEMHEIFFRTPPQSGRELIKVDFDRVTCSSAWVEGNNAIVLSREGYDKPIGEGVYLTKKTHLPTHRHHITTLFKQDGEWRLVTGIDGEFNTPIGDKEDLKVLYTRARASVKQERQMAAADFAEQLADLPKPRIALSPIKEIQDRFIAAEAAIAKRQKGGTGAKTPEEGFAAFWKAHLAGDEVTTLSFSALGLATSQDRQAGLVKSTTDAIGAPARGQSAKVVWREVQEPIRSGHKNDRVNILAATVVELDNPELKELPRFHSVLMSKEEDGWRVYAVFKGRIRNIDDPRLEDSLKALGNTGYGKARELQKEILNR